MKAVVKLGVVALMCTSAGIAMADAAGAPTIGATSWTPAQSAAPAMPATPVGQVVPVTPAQHATTQAAAENHSNGRLMLIGGLLIGVIALRSRKHLG
jgi:hypothetical protein